jgi:two-component system sensor histidine kinase KdpD
MRRDAPVYKMPDDIQRNPDLLLGAIQKAESQGHRGQLKVFLGMCPGVGKTYAMLEAARRELNAGRDVVIGYVETHGRKDTDGLAVGFERISRKQIEYRGVTLTELDLDAVLARHPSLALVDELAHTNVPGARHPKRWHDIQELLDAGINVFTTLNVQHVESRADTVRQITGAEIRETVPDSVLDDAVLELVDLPPAELVQRLHEGKVYVANRAATAVQNFFREANLTALRELALRLVADHVGEDTVHLRRSEPGSAPWKTGNLLLVAVGPGPFSEPLIRWTRRMADELRCKWLAVHVEAPQALAEAAQAGLARNLATARELGAEVVTTSDADVARGLLRIARDRNVTQMIVGKPLGAGLWAWWRNSRLMRRLTQESGDIDLYVVRADKSRAAAKIPRFQSLSASNLKQYLTAIGVVTGSGLINLVLLPIAGPRVPGLFFLLSTVLLALFVGRGPVFVAGALSALAWNFFFLPPRFTFIIQRPEDALLFGTYFVVALVLGQLVARIRAQTEAERRREERTTALYELTRDLAEASSRDEVVWHLIGQTNRVFRAPAAVILPHGEKLEPHPDSALELNEKELSVADWAFRQRKPAGKFTDNLPGSQALHLPLSTQRKTFGVLAVQIPAECLDLTQRDLLEAFARQGALVLDRIDLRAAAEQSRLIAESERLSRVILNSISHELRTPLAAITTAASSLAERNISAENRALLDEIQEANTRLNRIVGNLLDVARLESGKVVPRVDWHDARDLVQTTVRHLDRELATHPVKIEVPAEPMLGKFDYSLTQHALANLIVNAVMHTAPATAIDVSARYSEKNLILTVTDGGPGIPAQVLPRIFDKFFRGPTAPAGGSGLGLTIAKGFIEAQGGTITAANRPGGGAVFTLSLAQSELPQIEPAPLLS